MTETAPSMEVVTLARVIVPAPVDLLHYAVPESLRAEVAPGSAVRVPLGNRTTYGYVVDLGTAAPEGVKLREVLGLDSERPALSPDLVSLVMFAAEYYASSYAEVLLAALPPKMRATAAKYRLTDAGREASAQDDAGENDRQVLELARELRKSFTVAAVERRLGADRKSAAARLRRLAQRGWLERVEPKRKKQPSATAGEPRAESGPEVPPSSRRSKPPSSPRSIAPSRSAASSPASCRA